MKIKGIEYGLANYEEYLELFVAYALPEFKSLPTLQFIGAVAEAEPKVGEKIEVVLDGERTKNKQSVRFIFFCQELEGDEVNEKWIVYCRCIA